MLPVKSFITIDELERLASRSNFRYGQELVRESGIKITDQNTFNIVAEVARGKHDPETVELRSTTKGFRFKCTCSARKNNFCEHCTAVGLFMVKPLESVGD